jgi:hypothetical protein
MSMWYFEIAFFRFPFSLIIECSDERVFAQMYRVLDGSLVMARRARHRETQRERERRRSERIMPVEYAQGPQLPEAKLPADGLRSAAPDREAIDGDEMQARNRKAAAATVLAVSMLGHGAVNRWLAAGNCGPPEPLIRAAVLCAGSRQPVTLRKKQLSESNLAGHVK